MRKKLKEKENSTSEKKDQISVEDMSDEEFSEFLEEQYIKEAEERQRELFADREFDDFCMTAQEVEASHAKFVQRLKEDGIWEASSESGAKIYSSGGRDTRKLAKAAGIGIVCALGVFAAGMTSEANRNYFINGFRILSGSDTRMVIDNDDGNEKADADEYQAMADIEEKLGVKVPEFYYRPYGLEFKDYSIDEMVETARIEYGYNDSIITFFIDEQNEDTASYTRSLSGENEKTVLATTENLEVKIERIEEEGDEKPGYSAKWKRDNVVYYLYGRMEESELLKIIENMDF